MGNKVMTTNTVQAETSKPRKLESVTTNEVQPKQVEKPAKRVPCDYSTMITTSDLGPDRKLIKKEAPQAEPEVAAPSAKKDVRRGK